MADIRFRVEPQDTQNPLLYLDLYNDPGVFTKHVIVGPLESVTADGVIHAMKALIAGRYYELNNQEPG